MKARRDKVGQRTTNRQGMRAEGEEGSGGEGVGSGLRGMGGSVEGWGQMVGKCLRSDHRESPLQHQVLHLESQYIKGRGHRRNFLANDLQIIRRMHKGPS